MDPLEVAGGQLAHPAACRGRAGERDDPHQRVGDHGLPGVHAAWQHVQQPVGQAGLLEDPGQDDAAADRGARVRLEYDRVAEGERRGDRADREDLREVERGDHADDADRDPLGEAEPRLLARQQLAVRAGRQPGRLVDLLDRDVRLELGGGTDLAALADHPALDLGGVLLPQQGGPAQDRGALGVRRGRPGPLRLARQLHRPGDIAGGSDADAAKLVAGGRLDDGGAAAVGADPAARVHLPAPGLIFEKCHNLSQPLPLTSHSVTTEVTLTEPPRRRHGPRSRATAARARRRQGGLVVCPKSVARQVVSGALGGLFTARLGLKSH